MATVTVDVPPQDIVLHLRLNREEAEKLKSMMQNEWFSGEGDTVRNLRETIWDALMTAGVKSI